MSDHYRRSADLAEILSRIDDVSTEGLAPLDQFHSGGLAATRDLARFGEIKSGERVLDVGCGVGGPARLLAREHGARVTGVDLSPDYIAIARALSQKSGVAVDFQTADALALPFAAGSFDVVWTQHATMNIAGKQQLYLELRRVLAPQGRLVFHDLLAGEAAGDLHLPVPWADRADESFLIAGPALRRLLGRCGFRERFWQDRTAATIAFYAKSAPPPAAAPPLGTHLLLGADFPIMAANLRRNLNEGRLGVAMGVLAASPLE